MTSPAPDFQVAKMIQQAATSSIRSIYTKADHACSLYEPLQQLADCMQAAAMPFRVGDFADYTRLTLRFDIDSVGQDVRIDRALQEFTETTGWELRRSEPTEPHGCDCTVVYIWLRHPQFASNSQAIDLVLYYWEETHV
ncbi:hypothetical protein [Eikenella sp. Marseille-P7795]|uniref:hypothetical protein n=1 Tax=Eikenella sp. Marseille-P7795 TaxID=2866577 RepID=UPI001CE41FBF|nr:hypothetical protein [Eikenella sp. Marseille-P7795]